MRFFSALAAILLIFLSIPSIASVDPSVERLPTASGWINWDRQVLKAVGHGVLPGDVENPSQATLMARSAAVADAYRNLAMAVNGVRVSGETYVKNFVTTSDEVRVKVQGFIHGAEIVSERQLPDRSFEVVLQLPVAGEGGLLREISSEILPQEKREIPDDDGTCTGVIVDARGLGVKPAMSPKIYDADGNEVYGTVDVSPDYAIESGIAVYPQSLEQALRSPRAGKSPVIVKAVSRGAKFDTDVIVRDADASRIREIENRTGVLSRCRVSILIGPAAKPDSSDTAKER
jgi:hypothetical protein